MRLESLHAMFQHFLQNAVVVGIAGLGAGCSADTMRFADLYTEPASTQSPVVTKQTGEQSFSPTSSTTSADQLSTASVPRTAMTPVISKTNIQRAELSPIHTAPQESNLDGDEQSSVSTSHRIPEDAAVATSENTEIVVQPGESLFRIASKNAVPPDALMQANKITDPNRIQVGQRLKLPSQHSSPAVIATTAPNAISREAKQEKMFSQQFQKPTNRPIHHNGIVLPQTQTSEEKQLGTAALAATKTISAVSSSPGETYRVQSGDSLYAISQKLGVSVDSMKTANGLTSGALRVGQSLIVPETSNLTKQSAVGSSVKGKQVAPVSEQLAQVQTDSTPQKTAAVKPYTPPQGSPQGSYEVINAAEKDTMLTPTATGISQMRWPVRGKILSSFALRDGGSINDGIDIMVPEGTSVKAAENGVVIYAGDGLKAFGNTVLVRHENGLVTVYGHNSQLLVQRGQKVRRGEEIARSGMTGNAKSPKLHFEVRKNSTPVNPSKYLES